MGLGAASLAKVSNEVTKALQESTTGEHYFFVGKEAEEDANANAGQPAKQGKVLDLNQSPRWLFYSFVYVACLC